VRGISAARFADVLATPPWVSAEWGVFALHVIDDPPVHFEETFVDHVVTLQASGTFRFRQQTRGRVQEEWCGPGCIGITPANLEATWDQKRNPGIARATSVFIPPAFLSRVIAQDWEVEPRRVELVGQFLTRDPVIESVLTGLMLEAQSGSPSGRLYAESACEFLAHHLIHCHSSLRACPRERGGLPGRRLKAVLDYIHDCIASPISLRELAQVAGVSPRHFERAFRQAVGVPPHAYVIAVRVAASKHLLIAEPTLAVEHIATRVGFGSASHLAAAFRRRTGCSPTAFRQLYSR
jgi:AraC family transcriptional regulator